MTQTDLDPYGTMAEEAKRRLKEFINRSSGQHKRAMRNTWGASVISSTEYKDEQAAKNLQMRSMLDAMQ